MKKTIALLISGLTISSLGAAEQQSQLLEGDLRLACEAKLCLAVVNPPSECQPSLERYFSIRMKKPNDTNNARLRFLDLCSNIQQNQESFTIK